MSIIEHEQKVALLKRAEGLKSAESGPLGDRVGSPSASPLRDSGTQDLRADNFSERWILSVAYGERL